MLVCECEKVECRFETHSCTNYEDAQAGVQYHSDTKLWSGNGNDGHVAAPNVAAANAMVATPSSATARHTSIAERDTRGSTGNAGFTSGFDNRHDEVDLLFGYNKYGVGDQHGTVTSNDGRDLKSPTPCLHTNHWPFSCLPSGHDFSGTCVNTESVRVYHKNEDALR